jgi:hypothetical protein
VTRRSTLVALLTVLPILAATLMPQPAVGGTTAFGCVVCGERGTADAILNVLLFLPFGVALGMAGTPSRLVWLAGPMLSAVVETGQVFIPGRDAGLGDLLFNSVGATLGLLVFRTSPLWGNPSKGVAARCCLAVSAAVASWFVLTGALLQPSFPPSTYFGQWTPDLGHLEQYRGRVLEVELGQQRLLPQRLSSAESVRRAVLSGTALTVEARIGPPTQKLASIFSVYDERQREIFLLGGDGGDLVFRYRMRAADLRLDGPDIRMRDGLEGFIEGDTTTLSVMRHGSWWSLSNGSGRTNREGFTIGSGWTLLMFPDNLPGPVIYVLGGIWVALLLAPVGYWARIHWVSGMAVATLALVLIAVPPVVGLLPTPASQWGGFVSGLLMGAGLQRMVRRATLNAWAVGEGQVNASRQSVS